MIQQAQRYLIGTAHSSPHRQTDRQTDRHADHASCDICNNRQHLCTACRQCGLMIIIIIIIIITITTTIIIIIIISDK